MRRVFTFCAGWPTLLGAASLVSLACGDEHAQESDSGSSAASDAKVADAAALDASAREAGANWPEAAAGETTFENDASPVAHAATDAAPWNDDAGPGCGICSAYGAAVQKSQVGLRDLDELSGLTLGRTNRDVLFAHNDLARTTVYALGLDGRLRATITLDRAFATDLEDIAAGPCPAGTCLYLADIGDNATTRKEYAILRFVEPALASATEPQNLTVSAERFTFVYEDGSHNAEGFMVSPAGELYLVTKGMGPSSVYRLPALLASDHNVATKVATLPVPAAGEPAASAASAHPCGLGFLLRTYDKVYEFRARGGDFESAFVATPKLVAMPSERQSEGISYLGNGRGFLSSGEGASAPISSVTCE